MCVHGCRGAATQERRDAGTQRRTSLYTQGATDQGTRGRGDAGTRGRGDAGTYAHLFGGADGSRPWGPMDGCRHLPHRGWQRCAGFAPFSNASSLPVGAIRSLGQARGHRLGDALWRRLPDGTETFEGCKSPAQPSGRGPWNRAQPQLELTSSTKLRVATVTQVERLKCKCLKINICSDAGVSHGVVMPRPGIDHCMLSEAYNLQATMPCRVLTCRAVSRCVAAHRGASGRVVSCCTALHRSMPCPVASCRVLSRPVASCRVLWCPVASCRILPVVSFLSCPVVSCRSCGVLSCSVFAFV